MNDNTIYQLLKLQLLNSEHPWRFVSTLAKNVNITQDKAIQLLYEDPDVVFGFNSQKQSIIVQLKNSNSNRIPSGITFHKKSIEVGDTSLPYLVHIPPSHSIDNKRPVILFLHGSGERGDDDLRQMREGIGPALRQHPQQYPALVVMPQLPQWPGHVWQHEINGVNTNQLLLKALDQTLKEYNGDSKRQYLSGISMGAFGCWFLASEHPNRFAAMSSICGGIYEEGMAYKIAKNLTELPIYVFHGEDDDKVNIWCSQQIVSELIAVGSTKVMCKWICRKDVELGNYIRNDHFIWPDVYKREELSAWMFAQNQ